MAGLEVDNSQHSDSHFSAACQLRCLHSNTSSEWAFAYLNLLPGQNKEDQQTVVHTNKSTVGSATQCNPRSPRPHHQSEQMGFNIQLCERKQSEMPRENVEASSKLLSMQTHSCHRT